MTTGWTSCTWLRQIYKRCSLLRKSTYISEAKHKEGTYINNDTIMERNALLKTLADNVTVFWLDANQAICDENHFLRKEYTFDGVHLQAKYVPIWVMWLESNAVDLGESLQ